MGVFRHRVTITNAASRQAAQVDCIVDTGSTYLWLPEDLLRSLGVQPTLKRRLKLATGQVIERPATEVLVTLNGETLSLICVFGEAPGYSCGEREGMAGVRSRSHSTNASDGAGRQKR